MDFTVRDESGREYRVSQENLPQAEKDGFYPIAKKGKKEFLVPASRIQDAEKDGFTVSYVQEEKETGSKQPPRDASVIEQITATGQLLGEKIVPFKEEIVAGLSSISPIPEFIGGQKPSYEEALEQQQRSTEEYKAALPEGAGTALQTIGSVASPINTAIGRGIGSAIKGTARTTKDVVSPMVYNTTTKAVPTGILDAAGNPITRTEVSKQMKPLLKYAKTVADSVSSSAPGQTARLLMAPKTTLAMSIIRNPKIAEKLKTAATTPKAKKALDAAIKEAKSIAERSPGLAQAIVEYND